MEVLKHVFYILSIYFINYYIYIIMAIKDLGNGVILCQIAQLIDDNKRKIATGDVCGYLCLLCNKHIIIFNVILT